MAMGMGSHSAFHLAMHNLLRISEEVRFILWLQTLNFEMAFTSYQAHRTSKVFQGERITQDSDELSDLWQRRCSTIGEMTPSNYSYRTNNF
jgi:hypothetical protein